ncbi:MAG TPA: S46 family peptidase [Kofleriaceae bacterium]|nr:S46 family peptidase [Kofleriaceae bacterium]
MKRTSFVVALLFAAACGGKKTPVVEPTPGSGSGSVTEEVPGAVVDPFAPGAVTQDPALEARKAFRNPGGMWMPRQMAQPPHAAILAGMGVKVPASALADPLAAPLDAVVSLGGCTGSFVSPDGLIVTNHHCVQGALQINSTPDKNYVETGFLAKTRPEELPAGPAQKVSVAQAFTDITSQIRDGLDTIKDPIARTKELEKRQNAAVAACEKDRPGIRCDVKSFYRGSEWQLIEYLEIRDVRLVYVPPRSVGDYGGEIDNWAWPRHTGDWSFFRAYVGKDGKVADPSPDNVPYHPKAFLKVDRDGLKSHDFVMVAGYPGRTTRITTYDEVKFDVDWTYPYVISLLQQRYDLLQDMVDGKTQVPADTKLKAGVNKQFVQNGLEKYQGVLAGLQKGDMMAQKKAIDDKARAWLAQPGHEADAAAVAKMDAMIAEDHKTARADFDFAQTVGSSALLATAVSFVRQADERTRPDAARKPGYQERDLPRKIASQKQFARQFDPIIDRATLRLSLVRDLDLPEADRPWLATIVGAKKGAKIDEKMIDKALDALYKGTKLADEKTRLDLLQKATPASLKASKDTMVKLAVALWPTVKQKDDKDDREEGDELLLQNHYAEAMRQSLGGNLPPDANSTLRVTYGTVRPFDSGGRPFTVLSEILAKDTGKDPFDAPKAELDAIKAKTWGPYASPELGEVPADFIADLDITGGNSGSPALDADGELVGLAFDGNIEGVASDVVFNPDTTRTIIVDVRYMLWYMDLLDQADNVLTELGVTPSM